jgi:hypothetical protein
MHKTFGKKTGFTEHSIKFLLRKSSAVISRRYKFGSGNNNELLIINLVTGSA